MTDPDPLTIEVLGATNGSRPTVLDRVIGGTVYLDEAKRIGHHLLSIIECEALPKGFRVLSPDRRIL
jgi:hypothetical protein